MINRMLINKYPKTLSNGVVIVNEVCKCGKLITEHGGYNGHGASLDGQCDKFTWAKWILEGDLKFKEMNK